MSNPPFLYIGNWKMQLPFEQAIALYKNNKENFEQLAAQDDRSVVLCPSFDVLFTIAQQTRDSSVLLGAQDCAAYETGAYTGQVSAKSLKQIGCRYCIVGHSEYRARFADRDADIAEKVKQLVKNNIFPIICIGETRSEYEQKMTYEVIDKQVRSIVQVLRQTKPNAHICIAYEPIWAIGTGDVPLNEYIESVFKHIGVIVTSVVPKVSVTLLYGGSVSGKNAEYLKQIRGLGGFLIGGASVDFQKFEKIVT